jgi:hypothetical protein
MRFRRIVIVLAVSTILMGLAYSASVWAAPDQSPARQTVPTRTPHVPPKEEKDTPTPVPTFIMPTPTPRVTLTSSLAPQTLPASGSTLSFPAGLMAVGLLLVLTGWVARRQIKV